MDMLQQSNPALAMFKRKLGALQTKSQSKIRELTTLAEENEADAGNMIIVWEGEVRSERNVARFAALFALVDAILKKVAKGFTDAFALRLVDVYPYCVLLDHLLFFFEYC